MKCPECGSVRIPGAKKCNICGNRFTRASGEADGVPPLFHKPSEEAIDPSEPDSQAGEDRMEFGEPESGGRSMEWDWDLESPPQRSIDPEEHEQKPKGLRETPPWQTELAERVQEYRQRRAKLGKNIRTNHENLDFDFEPRVSKPEKPRPRVIEFPSAEEPMQPPRETPKRQPEFRSPGLEDLDITPKRKEDAPAQIRRGKEFRPEMGPLEIELEPSAGASLTGIGKGEDSAMQVAPIGMRFFAGVLDALVLLLGAAVYGLIFWRTGGHFSQQPLELIAGGLIAVFFIFLYFGGCTAIASATPGLIWAGLEVRTFEGNSPRLSECFWRAFGYLVSMSALMLGFVWAAVDADGLSWHDRMSRTFLAPANYR